MAEGRRRFVSNIVNPQAIDVIVGRYRARLRDPELRRWWSRNARNFLVREASLFARIAGVAELAQLHAAGTLPCPVRRWAVIDLSVGRPVHRFLSERFEANAGLHATAAGFELIAAWMTSLPPDSRHHRRLHRISVPEARRLAEAWRRGPERPAGAADAPGEVNAVMQFDDGYRIVELSTPGAFRRESLLMRNCLHDIERFRGSSVYSLRDGRNRPHVELEFQGRLLVQVKGFANSTPRPKYHSYLKAFLRLMRVPESEINHRLGLIEMSGAVYPNINECVEGFARWAGALAEPGELPFMRDPAIRDFLNVYTRFGRRASTTARRTVLTLFRPHGRAWRNHPGTEAPLPGAIQLWHPRLPAALMHMARYDAVPESEMLAAYRAALTQVIARAKAEPGGLYDLIAENRALADGGLAELLDTVGLYRQYEAARRHACRVKLAALQRSTDSLARQLRRRDLTEARRSRICHVVQDVYPRLRGRLLSADAIL